MAAICLGSLLHDQSNSELVLFGKCERSRLWKKQDGHPLASRISSEYVSINVPLTGLFAGYGRVHGNHLSDFGVDLESSRPLDQDECFIGDCSVFFVDCCFQQVLHYVGGISVAECGHRTSPLAGLLDWFTTNGGRTVLARRAISERWLADKAQCDRSMSLAARSRAHPIDRACARFAAIPRRVLPSSEILKEAVPTETWRLPTRCCSHLGSPHPPKKYIGGENLVNWEGIHSNSYREHRWLRRR